MHMKLFLSLALSLFLLGCLSPNPDSLSQNEVIVYKSASCGCCNSYVAFLDKWGYSTMKENVNMDNLFSKYNIPRHLQSCHLSQFQGYYVIGHVPKEAIDKLFEQNPDLDGISLPDMPTGTPGMPGPRPNVLTIYGIKDGSSSIFMQIT